MNSLLSIFTNIFSSFSSWIYIVLAAMIIAGIGGTMYYRMQWLDCKASAAQAYEEQRKIDLQDNSKSIAFLNKQLEINSTALKDATVRLNNVQKTTVCGVTPALRATHDELCKLYPKSDSCH